ncbi:hypothetical protein Pcinc_003753 [Petrolisthes cinctipes]|uniref:Uncharacterized protein n=1 Tax=Petrolisthes cinctipes TaxID=88211 RepID=A0AAE1GMX1_PETCI|nr:hypothetical protein Pcinc_003753 [Petrolisthes cinctipes]
MNISTNPILIPSSPRFKYAKETWEGFTDTLSNTHTESEYEGKYNTYIDDQLDLLHIFIQTAANNYIPETSYSFKCTFTSSIRSSRLLICYRTRFKLNKHPSSHKNRPLSP